MRNAYKILEGSRSLERPTRIWQDTIKWISRKTECEGVDWITLAGGGSCEHGNEPSGFVSGG
jgi:hypothetical protein